MSGANAINRDRLRDLLADRAMEGLAPEHHDEVARLLRDVPGEDADAFDWAAAAVDLPAIAGEIAPMPARLRSRVETDAVAWLARSKGLVVVDAGGAESAAPAPVRPSVPRADPAPSMPGWIGWLAAAACLAIAVTAWWPAPEIVPDLGIARLALLEDDDTRLVAWNDAAELGVSGDVAWNPRTQSGFMRFRGLDVNDPVAMQYQLWIFDASRQAYSDKIAVDGGVFDVDRATGDVIVPIRAKLDVKQPTVFAVTTEPPGGVVEHNPDRDPERYRIILTAPL